MILRNDHYHLITAIKSQSNEHGPKRVSTLEIDAIEGGFSVYQAEKNRVHFLNHTALLILELCNGRNSAERIAELIQDAFGLAERPDSEVREILAQMAIEALVEIPCGTAQVLLTTDHAGPFIAKNGMDFAPTDRDNDKAGIRQKYINNKDTAKWLVQRIHKHRFQEHEILDQCPVCRQGLPESCFVPELKRCSSCKMYFRSPRPTQDEIRRFYDTGSSYRDWAVQETIRRTLFERRLERLQRHARKGRLLDVSTGDGHFLQVAAEAGFVVQGTEFSHYAARMCQKRGFAVHVDAIEELDFGAERFDVITLWHVLEHSPFPGELLRRVHSLLEVDGVLAVAVPNEAPHLIPWLRKCEQRHPLSILEWGMEVHLIHFQPATFQQSLRAAGFKILEFGVDDVATSPTWCTPFLHGFHEMLGRLTGWHGSTAMVAVVHKL